MTTATVLRSLERALLAVGLALGIWCGAVLLNAHFVARMPLPAPPDAAAASAPRDKFAAITFSAAGRSCGGTMPDSTWIEVPPIATT